MYNGIDQFFHPFEPCECCKTKYISMTVTTHKWTEQEIKDSILEIASELSKSKWGSRGHLLEQLRHWQSKLDKLNEVRSEIDLKIK